MSVEAHLARHLAKWGLREFLHEADYYAWQRQTLSSQVLHRLNEFADKRQGGIDAEADRDFYDLASSSTVLPVLYSQRVGYFRAVGTAISQCLEPGKTVLDFGCGVGILTTWYASLFPNCVFTGVDRSSQSISVAQQQAEAFKLDNVSFQTVRVPRDDVSGMFDVIISTQALFQSETDPGLPSRSWESFEREDDAERQRVYESRTGIGERLDWLLAKLSPMGRLLVFEKASHLGRRVPFQRALARRELGNNQEPVFLSYTSFDEQLLDGPLYSVQLKPSFFSFDENPHVEPMDRVYRCQGSHADWVWSQFFGIGSLDQPVNERLGDQEVQWQMCLTASGLLCGRILFPGLFSGVLVGLDSDKELVQNTFEEIIRQGHHEKSRQEVLRRVWVTGESSEAELTPLYENHSPSAQDIWRQLSGRHMLRETTQAKADGQQYHVEFGRCAGQLAYLYWANTLDQRQIVVMEEKREHVLGEYFSESCGDM